MREISLHILDIARNSIEAGATRLHLTIHEDTAHDQLSVEIIDNGRGMDEVELYQATDAFHTSRKTRRQGLGLPLFKATCERCGGTLGLTSRLMEGTQVNVTMQLSHLDRPPLGDMGAVIQALACEAKKVHLTYVHTVGDSRFILDTNELQWELDDVSLRSPLVLEWLRRHVNECLQNMGA